MRLRSNPIGQAYIVTLQLSAFSLLAILLGYVIMVRYVDTEGDLSKQYPPRS
jgi:hypothetical protein